LNQTRRATLWASWWTLHAESLGFASHFHQFIAIEFTIAVFVKAHGHVDKVLGARPIHPRPKAAWTTRSAGTTKTTWGALGARAIGGLSKT